MLQVSAALMERYKQRATEEPFREGRKAMRRYRPRRQLELERGTTVEEVWEEPSPTGMPVGSIPHVLPVQQRMDEPKVIKSARRGGKKASKKAIRAREAKKTLSQASALRSVEPVVPTDPAIPRWIPMLDAAERMRQLAEALGGSEC